MKITVRCSYCGDPIKRERGHVTRSSQLGLRQFCGRRCFGLDRRKGKTKAQKVAEKRLYDMAYRGKNRAMLKAKKRAYFERTYDPSKAAVERKKRMHLHVAYCRQPRYKAWKREYDRKYRAREYGPFAEAYMLAVNLNREVKSRASNYEIRIQNQTLNKRQARSRSASQPQRGRRAHPGA
jgi:hypothetical protein